MQLADRCDTLIDLSKCNKDVYLPPNFDGCRSHDTVVYVNKNERTTITVRAVRRRIRLPKWKDLEMR